MKASDVTIVVRECGERTFRACLVLLRRIFPGHEIHCVSARPFSATLRLSLEKGLAENRPWTLCIDADVLVLPELVILLEEALNLPPEVFEIQGLVYDKLMTIPRAAGNHLYRTALIAQALPLIPDGHDLRPETQMIQAMATRGFPCQQSLTMVGLHDFEQSFRDLYAKAYLHGYKHRFLLPLYRPLWQMLARTDEDYRVALAALDEALADDCIPIVSRDFRAGETNSAVARLGLEEKPSLEAVPDDITLHAWTEQADFHGEARTLSRQIASTQWRGLFPTNAPVKVCSAEIKNPLVALFSPNVYPFFDFCIPSAGDGIDACAALYGRGLASLNRWQISFIVNDFGQPLVSHHEDIDFRIYQPAYCAVGRNVFPRFRKRSWFPTLNLDRHDLDLLWQMPLIAIWRALPALFFPRFWRRLKPMVVCCFGNNALTAEVIADCRRAGIRTILLIASEKDISPDYRAGDRTSVDYSMPKWKGQYSLSHADHIIVQTETQRKALRQHFGRDAVLVRNPVHVSVNDLQRWTPRAAREFVLWIGSADSSDRRPFLYLDLARDCPNLRFVMIASHADETILRKLEQASPPNLLLVKHRSQLEIWDYLHRTRVLVNTSKSEDFPYTFLQAAVMGVPVVSLHVDPDGMLTHYGCGVSAAGSPRAMREAVVKLCADYTHADALAIANHRYVLDRHEASGRIAELEACIADGAAASGQGKPPWWMLMRRFA